MGCYYEARFLLSTLDELFPLLCCRDSENVTMMDGLKLWYGTYLSIGIEPNLPQLPRVVPYSETR